MPLFEISDSFFEIDPVQKEPEQQFPRSGKSGLSREKFHRKDFSKSSDQTA
jgi:hypothetical protein